MELQLNNTLFMAHLCWLWLRHTGSHAEYLNSWARRCLVSQFFEIIHFITCWLLICLFWTRPTANLIRLFKRTVQLWIDHLFEQVTHVLNVRVLVTGAWVWVWPQTVFRAIPNLLFTVCIVLFNKDKRTLALKTFPPQHLPNLPSLLKSPRFSEEKIFSPSWWIRTNTGNAIY